MDYTRKHKYVLAYFYPCFFLVSFLYYVGMKKDCFSAIQLNIVLCVVYIIHYIIHVQH